MVQCICRDLSVGYDSKIVAGGIDFTIEKGDYICILGENGSGKSTFVKTLLGLIEPVSGSIEFKNRKKNGIGYLPQQTEVQRDFPATVGEIVLSGCQGKSGLFYSKKDKASAEYSMKKTGILNLSKKSYRELSGGQQQRVLLSRALCAADDMLLLDEPAAGLDPESTEIMYSLIEKLNRDDGVTILMVTHDIPSAMRYAKHVLHIGKQVTFSQRDDYFLKNNERGEY